MATEFLMPKLGLTMEEGTIAEWLVADGETVTAGAAVLRIETDKTETEVEAAEAGRLHVVGQVGDTFACGERIGWFLADGEDAPSGGAPAATATTPPAPPTATAPAATSPATTSPAAAVAATLPGGRIVASPMARRLAGERNIDLTCVQGTGPGGRIVSEDLDELATSAAAPVSAPVTALAAPSAPGAHVPATAAARQLADLLGVEVADVAIEPADGRVTRDTVAQHVRSMLDDRRPDRRHDAAPAAVLPAAQTPTDTIRLSGMRGTIAKRMHQSLTEMAQLTLHLDADLDAVVADRTARKTSNDGRAVPSYTDYVIAASARALLQHPLANSQITDDGVALLPVAHVGMAVALDGGLIVPVISDTNSLDLASLSGESTRLAQAARSGSLSLPELEGGTFSVSTLGMYGVDGFTPVINPPNTAILGVGRIRDDLALVDGEVTVTKRMTLSLTWDHRAFDGAPAAAFAKTIADLLGDPATLDTTI